jgi:hypothetical protein
MILKHPLHFSKISSKLETSCISNVCERDKRNYTKGTNEYWSDLIFKQRAAKIYEEMSLLADKYSENDPALVQSTTLP